MPVGCGDLFDFLWRECHARPTDAICRDLARMSSIKWASVPPEGNRDPTNFRRVISRYRGGATHCSALLSRVRAPHVQYWSPQLSRNCKPDSSIKSKPTESSYLIFGLIREPACINNFVIERRALPPGENVVVEVKLWS